VALGERWHGGARRVLTASALRRRRNAWRGVALPLASRPLNGQLLFRWGDANGQLAWVSDGRGVRPELPGILAQFPVRESAHHDLTVFKRIVLFEGLKPMDKKVCGSPTDCRGHTRVDGIQGGKFRGSLSFPT